MKSKNMENFDLTEVEKDDIFYSIILPSLKNDLKASDKPKAYILGGQPAAGKSHFIKNIIQQDKNIVIINGDDFRGYHPNYNYFLEKDEKNAPDLIQKDINYWIEKAIFEISLERYSLIVEGTMKNVEVPLKTANFLKNLGYSVELDVILVNPEISKVDILKRYAICKNISGVARFTKLEAHNETIKKIFENILFISNRDEFNIFRLFRREIDKYNLLFEGGVEIKQELSLEKILKEEQNRDLNEIEKEYLKKSWEMVVRLSEYCPEIKDFIREFKSEKNKEYNLGNEIKFR